jgi:hypothetical protein
MSIEIRGTADAVWNEVYGEVAKTIDAEPAPEWGEKDDAETVTDWLWKHFASTQQHPWQESTATFAIDSDTWEDVLDAYRQDRWETHEEGRVF